MATADQLRARATRAANRTPGPAEHSEPVTPPEVPAMPTPAAATDVPTMPVRTKPVRITVDLSPLDHRHFRQHREALADQLGLPTLPAAVVIRALLTELAEQPELASTIRNRIAAEIARQ